MKRPDVVDEIGGLISSGAPLGLIISALREYRRLGTSRDEVQLVLEGLRSRVDDEAVEDRILEVMDIVSGFCSRENTIWDE